MYFAKRAACTAAVAAILGFGSAANAADARLSDCVHMAKQVAAAINTAQPGQTVDEAVDLANAGRAFCAAERYTLGVARYGKALQLLGKG